MRSNSGAYLFLPQNPAKSYASAVEPVVRVVKVSMQRRWLIDNLYPLGAAHDRSECCHGARDDDLSRIHLDCENVTSS